MHTRTHCAGNPIRTLLVLTLLPAASCVSVSRESQRSLQFDEPRVSSGVIVEEPKADRFAQAVAQLEMQRERDADFRNAVARQTPRAASDIASAAVFSAPDTENSQSGGGPLPDGAGKSITLTSLSETEIAELLDVLALKFQTEYGYTPAAPAIADFMPAPPDRTAPAVVLARNSDEGLRLLRFTHRRYLSQASQLLVHGVILGPDSVVANDDIQRADEWTTDSIEAVAQQRGELTLDDLEAEVVQLSYVNADAAMQALENLGVRVRGNGDPAVDQIPFEDLPIVSKMPAPLDEELSFIEAADTAMRDASGLFTIPSSARRLGEDTVSGPSSQLLVMFHPAHPEQHSRVLRLLSDLIDLPARQVFIEGMVIEIGEEGLKELGVEWQFQDGSFDLLLGSLDPGRALETLGFAFDDAIDVPTTWSARLRALVTERKAEILARPSVMTIDNRQATIRVGTDIPVATSQEGLGGGSSKIAFDFRYIPTGILLNIRPRIDAESDQISMQIDTTVSSALAGEDLEIFDEDGTLLASAPTIASRRVQTYARIPNNTPLIIGGLVSRETDHVKEKVPLLGDLPLIGGLFRSERSEESRREVIIVLTPYVLPEDAKLGRMYPKSEEIFDINGFSLHRDVHRLREPEVFDLSFLTTNRRLVDAKQDVNDLIRRNFRYAATSPFNEFTGDRIPGEHILVERMMYEVIKNLELADPIDVEKIIYFGDDPNAGYRVRFLGDLLAELADGKGFEDFFKNNPGKAIAMQYHFDRESTRPGALGTERIPEISIVDCADRDEWGRLLRELNQPDAQGRTTATILIHAPEDLVRLRRAIVLKRMALLNGGAETQRLKHFRVGTMVQIPEIDEEDVQVVDSDVALLFYHTEHYYTATIDRIERALVSLDDALASLGAARSFAPAPVTESRQ